MRRSVIALRPSTGERAWTAHFDEHVLRVFVMMDRVLFCVGSHVHCHVVATGQALGSVDIQIVPESGMVCGDLLVLVGPPVYGSSWPQGKDGWFHEPLAVCLSNDGQVVWRIVKETQPVSFGQRVGRLLRTTPNGEESVVLDSAATLDCAETAIAWGSQVAQTDWR